MSAVKPKVQGCYDTYNVPGTVFVSVTPAADGTVARADVSGNLANTPEGDCVAQAVRLAAFPKGGQGCLFVYPYLLRTPRGK